MPRAISRSMIMRISSICSVARGSMKREAFPVSFTSSGMSTPSARISAWNCSSVLLVTARMASLWPKSG